MRISTGIRLLLISLSLWTHYMHVNKDNEFVIFLSFILTSLVIFCVENNTVKTFIKDMSKEKEEE